MSVSFAPSGLDGAVVAHPADCDGQDGLCAAYGCYEYVEVGLNVGNANALSLLAALGIDAEPEAGIVGTIDAEELVGRCLMALALADDSALPGSDDGFPGAPRRIDCGRRVGYMTERLSALLAVAEQARSLGVTVTYA